VSARIISAAKLKALGHDARLMPAKYVRPYSKGQKNDFRDAETIAEAVPAGAKLFFLPKYSPDLNPIEQAFAKLKQFPAKRCRARTVDAVCLVIGEILPSLHARRNAPTISKIQATGKPNCIML